jgi:hypothetical protein
MKKSLLALSVGLLPLVGWNQTQIGNGNMESWEAEATGQEPTNWNSFLSAGGSMSWAAGDQCQSSTDVRPGSTGTKSANIFSNSVIGVIANGNLTLGKINMGSAVPSNSSNYNSSITSDANFSEALTVEPDSLVFWAKFVPANASGSDSARVSAILHDSYDLRDPIDAGSTSYVVATAIRNFKTANGWMRISVPFSYSGPATSTQFILLTFTTNKTPGGGSDNDQLFIDDVELVYNGSGASVAEESFSLPIKTQNGEISIVNTANVDGQYTVYSLDGKQLFHGSINQKALVSQEQIVIVHVETSAGNFIRKMAVSF